MWKLLDQLGLLFINILNAIKFAAYDYDAKLRITKTPKERLLIWIMVVFVATIVVLAIFTMIGSIVTFLLNR